MNLPGMNDFENPQFDTSGLSSGEMSKIFSKALNNSNLLETDDTSVLFYNLSFIENRINSLRRLFPETALHAIAVKANPLTGILHRISALGVGLEVASLPELYLAEKAGFAPQHIVFDSPCKTRSEIEYALRAGIAINADSLAELERIAELLTRINSKSKIGLRINPQVGTGNILSTSVAGKISKFGVPLNENLDRIIDFYLEHEWLKGIHVHIGSQGCPVPLLVDGIRKVLNLAVEINSRLKLAEKEPVCLFDIGGGLPVSYHPDQEAVTMSQYAALLKVRCPELFTGDFHLVTEFGRYIHANAGWVAARVEYVKREPGYNIVMTHVGADMFLRKCYNPGDWHHQISVLDKSGKLKTGTDNTKYIVAGPLCFAGDVLATDLELPEVVEGDYILIQDAGAYTLSMWSRYNSRQMPKVIGYRPEIELYEILKKRETGNDLLKFWS